MKIGDVIGQRFLLEAKAGAGGMGIVFRARDLATNSIVALKAMLHGEAETGRFAREIEALSRINHARVVRYVAHGHEDEKPYLAMEWLTGEDLSQKLSNGRLDVEGALVVVRGIAEALAALHKAGIVHRDIKPSNVFLVNGLLEEVKLLDLGIARTQEMGWKLTSTNAILGTPAYMAPEQARNEPIDARADLFALGCIFHECLAGQSPFAAQHPLAALARILMDEAPSLLDEGVSVPASVQRLLDRLVAKNLDDRIASAVDVLRELDQVGLERTTADVLSAPRGLTLHEQLIVSIVLSRPASEDAATMVSTQENEVENRARTIAAMHGARYEVLPNGSFLALFAGASSPRDHAAHAAAFALELAAQVGHEAVALATGRAAVSGRLPVGDVIDRAVALLRRRQTGIVLDAVSAALVEGRFETTTEGDLHQLIRFRDEHALQRTVAGQVSPCVGRERELANIAAAFTTSTSEPLASIVLLTAPAGTGKSRLVDEVLRSIRHRDDIALLLMGSCDMMNVGARYGVLARALRATIRNDATAETEPYPWIVDRIRASQTEGDCVAISELIAESCRLLDNVSIGSSLRDLRNNPLLLADAIADAWCRWLDAEATTRGAVVIVLEDLHWGDLPTIKLLDHVVRELADKSIFVLVTARPEFHELFPRSWADRGVQEIRLGHISARNTERLVTSLLGAHASPEIIKRIAERSGGHPFLIEELVRGAAADSSKLDDIPETVLGIIQARFFTQNDLGRAALRAASVFGETFWLHGAENLLSGVSLEAVFDQLIAAEFIVCRSTTRFAGHTEYAFRHALVRDAAYAMLTDADRVTGHLLAGRWLEAMQDRDPFVLAEHFDRGMAPEKAAYWYHLAAAKALEGTDVVTALRLGKRAIECGRQGEERAMTELILAEAAYASGDLAGGYEYAVSARGQLKRASDPWFSATTLIVVCQGQRGNNDDVLAQLECAIEVCTTPPTDAQLMCVCRAITQYAWVSVGRMQPFYARLLDLADQTTPGSLAFAWLERTRSEMQTNRWFMADETADHCERAQKAFARAGAHRDALMMAYWRCISLGHTNHPHDAVTLAKEMLAEAERRGLTYLRYFALFGVTHALFFTYDDAACSALINTYISSLHASPRLYAITLALRVQMAFDAGEPDRAVEHSEQLILLEIGARDVKFWIFGPYAQALALVGRRDDARTWADRALAQMSSDSIDPFCQFGFCGLAEALLALGDRDRALQVVSCIWNLFLSAPIDHACAPRSRVFQKIAKLAHAFGLPHAEPCVGRA